MQPLSKLGVEFVDEPLFDEDYLESLYSGRKDVRGILLSFARRIGALARATNFDAIWVEKEVLPWVPSLIELSLLPRRVPLVVDYDDAIFHRYDLHRSSAVRAVLGRKIDRVMARADLVVAGNDYLRARAVASGASRVEVVPTVVDLDRYPMSEPRHTGRPTIGWIGTPSTAHYLEVLTPVLQSLADAFEFDAVAIGARPDQLNGSAFVAKPWSEVTEASDVSAFDIGIMPLADTPWELGKCGYKLIQYMALGLPTVASAVGANKQIVSNGESGFLVDGPSGWLAALERLLGDRNLRVKFGLAGRAIVEQRYELKAQATRLAGMLGGLVR